MGLRDVRCALRDAHCASKQMAPVMPSPAPPSSGRLESHRPARRDPPGTGGHRHGRQRQIGHVEPGWNGRKPLELTTTGRPAVGQRIQRFARCRRRIVGRAERKLRDGWLDRTAGAVRAGRAGRAGRAVRTVRQIRPVRAVGPVGPLRSVGAVRPGQRNPR